MRKRITAIILVIVIFFGGLAHTEFLYAKEADTEEDLQFMPENESNIEAEDSFGGLLANALESEMDAQEGNNGYQIFSAEVEGTEVDVTFETLTSATVVVGIYEETGIKLLNLGSSEVTSEDSEVLINLEKDEMPQYFYLRVFLVDTETLRPLCKAYETPDYTKEMQDLFQSTTEDYEADRVLNLDDDITNNFAVYKDTTKIIMDDGENNQLINADSGTQSYVFEKADEEITSLQAGDIFSYRSNGEDLIVKVDTIHTDGTTVTIQGAETSMEEVFANVKINAGQTTSEVDMSQAVCGEGVTYLGKIEETDRSGNMGSDSRKVEIGESLRLEDEFKFEIEDKMGIINLSGNAKAGMGISVTAYVTMHHQKIDFIVDELMHMDVTAQVNLKEEIKLFTVPFSPIPAIHINVSLVIPVEVNAKITVTVDITAQQGFSYDTDAGFQSLTKSPEMKASVEIEGKLYVGLRLSITGDILDEELLSLSLYGEVGEEFTASIAKKEDADSVKHDCMLCLDGDIALKAGLYARLNIFKIIDNKEFTLMEKTCPQGDFYYCMDRNEFGFGSCPYQLYKITITVQDAWDFTALEGARVNKDQVTDKAGNVVCYLPSGNYKYPIELDGYQTHEKEFSVEGTPKKQMVYLKKDEDHQEPDHPDDDEDYMKAYYEILDMFYYKIGAGWDETEDVSYLWYSTLYGPKRLSDAGYYLKDLDGDGIPELFVASRRSGEYGIFEDLYTYSNGKVVHLVSSGERYTYYLRDDNLIYYEASGGAFLNHWEMYHLDSNKQSLVLDEMVLLENGTYYYGTEEDFDDYNDYDKNLLTIISEQEAMEIRNRFEDKLVSLDLTLFDTYEPKGETEKPDDFALRKAFREAIGSKNALYFRAEDYDNNGTREAFGITGNYDRYGDADDISVYFMNHNGQVSCIDEIEKFKYANIAFEGDDDLILDTGQTKFLMIGYAGQPAATLYGVKSDSAYQPEVSGEHAVFYKRENGTYAGGGIEGHYYEIYEYNPATGEFDYIDKEWVGGGVPTVDDANAKTFSKWENTANISTTAPTITENPDSGVKTAIFTDLLPNEQYNFYVMRSSENDSKFSQDNLFYIQQTAADERGKLSIEYDAEYIPDDAEAFVVGKTQADISAAQVSVPKLTYNGKEQFIQPIVTLGGKQLIEGADYELSGAYSASEVGSYSVTISGIGMYTGVIYADYQIVDGHGDLDAEAALVEAKNRAKRELIAYKNPEDYREAQKRELIKAIGEGRNAIDFAKDEMGVKKALSDAKAVIDQIKTNAQLMEEEEQARINISSCKTALYKTSYVYDGRKKEPVVTIKKGKIKLTKNEDYTVLYKNNVKVGTAYVTISGTGKYKGKITKTFKILPEGTLITGKIMARPRGFTVRWKKQKKYTSGYQIQYSLNKKFTKKTVTKTVKKNTDTKLNVKKLKPAKTYYVRIRTYQTVKGKRYCSAWSKVKNVVTKK